MNNYIRKVLPIIFSFLSIYFYAQDYTSLFAAKGSADGTDAFNIVPPSPESFFRTQFGNLNFNEFKGAPNIQIPIHEIKDGILKLPVSLNYSKSGVKVNDIPNSVGINWILETGGIITRTIYDLTDELASQRLVLNSTDLGYLSSQSGAQNLGEYTHDISNAIDNEIDIFNFSIPGYSGSFYLDKTLKPILLTQDYNLTLEVVDNFKISNSFIITTYDGTKYIFGGIGATEKTWVRLHGNRSGITSFYLKTIEDVSHNKIEFSYNQTNLKIIPLDEQETGHLASSTSASGTIDTAPSNAPIGSSGRVLNVIDSKFLDKITAGNEVIQFNYITEINSPFQKLGSIVVSKNGVNKKKISFDFINGGNASTTVGKKRFFLRSVKEYAINNNADTFVNEYTLDYHDALNLPERLSRNVDYLGYFNGKNNTALLPNLKLFGEQHALFNLNNNYADRTADFNYAQLGTLRSITYPTKGKTIFEYESLQAKVPTTDGGDCVIGNTNYVNLPYINEDDWLPLTNESSFTRHISQIDGNNVNVEIILNLHSDREINQPNKAKALFEIIDLTTNQVIHSKTIRVEKMIQDATNSYTVQLPHNKSYQFKFKVTDYCYECNGAASISYPNIWKKIEDSNVRLKKQYDITGSDTVNIKRLYYTDYNNINSFDAIAVPFHPEFKSYMYNQIQGTTTLPPPHDCITCFTTLYETLFHSNLQTSRVSSILQDNEETYFDINDPLYPKVTISYGGDKFEKGGEEKIFDMSAYTVLNSIPLRYPNENGMANSLIDNSSILNLLSISAENTLYKQIPLGNIQGKLISHRIFNNKNGNLFLKSIVKNDYTALMGNTIYSVAGIQLYPYVTLPPGVTAATSLDNMYITAYRFPTYSSFLIMAKRTEYIEDVPVNVSDDSSYKKLVTTTNYLYDNIDKQLSKSSTQFSDMKVQETTYKYAREKNNQRLITANMLAIPLETESKKNGQTVSKTETKYDNVANLFPSSVISSDLQNTTPYTEVIYEKYDAKGNLQQYKTKDGTSVSIVWGYNNAQPIAKIEGITYDALVQVAGSQLSAAIAASDTDASAAAGGNEDTILSKLNDLRIVINGFGPITTYTYDPLIGVRSITQPSGVQELYLYDSANRLKEIKQKEVSAANVVSYKTVKEFEYHYKN